MRRLPSLLALAGALAGAVVSAGAIPAFAYITAPGTPVRSGATYNQLPVTGTCTVQGVTSAIVEFRLSLVHTVNYAEATTGGLVYHYSLTAVCAGGADYVLANLTAPAAWAISDTAGTLTWSGLSVPSSFTGDTIDGWVGSVDVTSGAGPLGPVVYGADNATEKSGVVSRHKTISRDQAGSARLASDLNSLQLYLE